MEQKENNNPNSIKNLEAIRKIGEQIISTLDLSEVIDILHAHLESVMDAAGFVIYTYNNASKQLEIKYKLGKHENFVADNISIEAQDSFCAYTIRNKKEVVINDIQKEFSKYVKEYYWSVVDQSEMVQSFINLPLIVRNEAIGVMSVQSFEKNVYTDFHLEILRSLATYISIALNNADAYTQLNKTKKALSEQKKIVEDKNKDILDSILYAQRIQKSLLPTEKIITRNLKRMKK